MDSFVGGDRLVLLMMDEGTPATVNPLGGAGGGHQEQGEASRTEEDQRGGHEEFGDED